MGQPPGHDISDSLPAFRRLGWTEPIALGDHQVTFMLDGAVRIAIAHVFANEQWETAHVRFFAEWLRAHDLDREEYDRLKGGLIAADVWGTEHTRSKADFFVRVVNLARACRGLPPVRAL
jgi:GrpB protein